MTLKKRTTHFEGRIVTVTVDEVVLPNGHEIALEVIHHPGGAAVVALDDRGQVCLLRQYRHVVGDWIWELPAGKLEPDEPPLTTAQRELVEEAGIRASSWQSLGTYVSSPGVFTEVLHLFLAEGLEVATAAPEASEVIEVHWMPFAQACRWAADGTIRDGKTALGLMRALHLKTTAHDR